MPEPIHFHTDLYRREAVQSAAEKYGRKARIALADSNGHIVARIEPAAQMSDAEWCDVRDEFCTEALSLTVMRLRDLGAPETPAGAIAQSSIDEPPWELLTPFAEGEPIGLGWVLASLGRVSGGSASLALRHEQYGTAHVAVRRNGGAPLGIAHTDRLDFLLMNGGSGRTHTEDSIARALIAMAETLQRHTAAVREDVLASLLPHAETPTPDAANGGAPRAWQPSAPVIDPGRGVVSADVGDDGVSRLAFYDAVLAFADRNHVFLTRPEARRVTVQLRPRGVASAEGLATLAQDLQRAIEELAARASATTTASQKRSGLPPLPRQRVDLDALLTELDAADPTTLGLDFQPTRGPGHENLRVLNIRGTGACNSECAFCIEKFNPTHRPMPTTDATRQFIVDGRDVTFTNISEAAADKTMSMHNVRLHIMSEGEVFLLKERRPIPREQLEADSARGSGVGRIDSEALQERGDVLRLDQQGGARDAGGGNEPHRRQEQHRRGRRGPGPLRPR